MEIKINGIQATVPASHTDPGSAGAQAHETVRQGAPPPPERQVAQERAAVEEAAGKLNELFLIFDKSVKFTVDGGSGDIRVKIIDNKSQEVIREYPPEKVVDILRRISEAVGVLVDETA